MRILVIHTAFIGDIVLTTPLIKKIKTTYPKAEITYLTTPKGANILRNNPHINHIMEYDKRGEHKGLKGIWNIGKKLKLEAYNMVITPHRYLRSSLITWFTGAPIRKGYKNSTGSIFYTEKIPYNKNIHEVEKLLSFLPKKDDENYNIELFPDKLEKERVDKFLEHAKEKLVIVAPGSKWFTKKWPIEYFNEVITRLNERKDTTVVVVGGREELDFDVIKGENCIDLRGVTSILELAELIKRAKVLLSNDSSPIHIASAFKDTKIIAIFGPTIEKFGFFPWSKNSEVFQVEGLKCRPCSLHGSNSCPKKHFKCMREIKPEIILQSIERELDK